DGVQRFNVDRATMVIGSGDDCDILLPYSGVGQRHAVLSASGGDVEIEDLGTRKGVVVNGEKVRSARLEVLDEIRLGSIALLLEDVAADKDDGPSEPEISRPLEPIMTSERMLEHLAATSRWVVADSDSGTTLEAVVLAMLKDFGGGALFLFQGEGDIQGIKFVVASDARWLSRGDLLLQQVLAVDGAAAPQPGGEAVAIVGSLDGEEAWLACRAFIALDRQYLFLLALPEYRPGSWSPLPALRTLGDQLILGLVHHVGRYEPILFGRPQQRDLTLAQGLIAGESEAMKKVLSELRAAVDLAPPVLLRGEPGVSKELLARSLHLSGSRSEGPFVVVQCAGAQPQHIEADLFGAEVAGKHGPVVREAKLLAANGGTLYLEDVDLLPLQLQGRLMRYLRSGTVDSPDGREVSDVDVRLITSSTQPLEAVAARDHFRLDLAYRLSQFSVEVPPLRSRREDLPLLIQAAVNRCCHETGKRVQGITVKAMESLATHDYPGNLPELEAIIRRLVYLCSPGRPIDDSMLPEEVRLSKIRGLKADVSSELNLDRLVADCERAAIREALRRSDGNKSEAARQLGLSRNGLALKMNRLGLDA
ncbi:MAG: sigma 54-interacting transcriptional regulator, partial [Acidobacteriota bacterium]